MSQKNLDILALLLYSYVAVYSNLFSVKLVIVLMNSVDETSVVYLQVFIIFMFFFWTFAILCSCMKWKAR